MTAKKTYHHGDLATALIDAAVQLIAVKGVAALSLREVARVAGVSHAAPAHHFKDKAGLLTAIATSGLIELAEALTQAGNEKPATDNRRLADTGSAYIRFLLGHPAHAAVMYRPDLINANDPDYALASRLPGRVLTTLIEEAIIAQGRQPDVDMISDASIALWSQVHGFANLWMTANLGKPNDSVLLEETMQRMFQVSQFTWLESASG